MSADPHFASDEEEDVSLPIKTQRRVLLGIIVASLCVLAVILFVMFEGEDSKVDKHRVQTDNRSSLVVQPVLRGVA